MSQKLLVDLINDEKKLNNYLYSGGPYWRHKNKRTIYQLKKKGLSNFRGIDSGVGIRSVSGDKTGFSYSNNFQYENLVSAANTSKCIVKSGQDKIIKIGEEKTIKKLYDPISPLSYKQDDVKVQFLKDIDKYIRDKDARVEQVIVS